MAMDVTNPKAKESHHVRQELCSNRAPYRAGRRLTAVKAYTVSQESRYLLIQGVPQLDVLDDLLKRCALYGAIQEYRVLHEYPAEPFTQAVWVCFVRIASARIAKRKLDDESFFGGVLHVCYAPEYESVDDTRAKLQQRRREVAQRTVCNSPTRQHTDNVTPHTFATPDTHCSNPHTDNNAATNRLHSESNVEIATDDFPSTTPMPGSSHNPHQPYVYPILPPPPPPPASTNNRLPPEQMLPVYKSQLPPEQMLTKSHKKLDIRKAPLRTVTPRFTPRQVEKRSLGAKSGQSRSVDNALRRDACILGAKQGPLAPPGSKKVKKTAADRSFEKTSASIRETVKQFSSFSHQSKRLKTE